MNRIVALIACVFSLGACGIGPEDLNEEGAQAQDLSSTTAVPRKTPSTTSGLKNICSRLRTEQACNADALCKWVEVDDSQSGDATTGGHVIVGGLCILDVQQDPPGSSTGGVTRKPTTTSSANLANLCTRLLTEQACDADALCKWIEVDASGAPVSSTAGAAPDHIIVGGRCILGVEQDPPPPATGSSAGHP